MDRRYSRIAVITGVSSGIGAALVHRFVAGGMAVVGNARRAEALAELERELGEAFAGVPGDAADPLLQTALFEQAVARFGASPDLVVANAGRGLGGSVMSADPAQFEDILRLNVGAVLGLVQQAARRMVEESQRDYPQRAFDIIIIGSVVGRHVSPFSAVYGSTKFAVHALAEGLRREVGPKGIRVSLIEPGIVISGFQKGAGYSDDLLGHFQEKFGPLLVPEDVASAIHQIVTLPPHVHVSELMIRPTRQDYP